MKRRDFLKAALISASAASVAVLLPTTIGATPNHFNYDLSFGSDNRALNLSGVPTAIHFFADGTIVAARGR